MNRREFGKLIAGALLVPSMGLSVAEAVPVGIPAKYRGFNVRVDKRYFAGFYVKQVYVKNGDYHLAMMFTEDRSDVEIWGIFKPALDGMIDRKIGKRNEA